jgi:hypothetical protein
VWRQRRASRWDSEHRTWQQRGGYNGIESPTIIFAATMVRITGSVSTAYPSCL